MPSSQLSNSVSKGWRFPWISIVTWSLRIAVGALFVYSGFVKAIDVWGSFYKFNEYLNALGLPVYDNLTLTGVFGLCTVEFLVGICLLFGCYRRSAVIVGLAFMCVMLPLTLWIAISDPVADCGCFGDALIISNWATFWKNVIITSALMWLLKYNTRVPCIITPAFQWMAVIASALFVIAIGLYGYLIQPLIDFRPFPVGTSLVSEESDYNGPEYLFTYTRNGVAKEFRADNLPDEEQGWEYVSRREISAGSMPNDNQSSRDFTVMDVNGTENVSEIVITDRGDLLMLLIPSLKDVSAATTYKINMLYDWAESHDNDMAAVIAPHTGDLNKWIDLSMPRYELYTAEDTEIKELARGNPAVVLLRDGKIVWKSTLTALDEEQFKSPETNMNIAGLVTDGKDFLNRSICIYILAMALFVLISTVPRLTKLFRPLGSKEKYNKSHEPAESVSHDDKVRHEG